MFDNISKRLEVRQKYSAARRILNSVLDVWKSAQHGLLFFYILHRYHDDLFQAVFTFFKRDVFLE